MIKLLGVNEKEVCSRDTSDEMDIWKYSHIPLDQMIASRVTT